MFSAYCHSCHLKPYPCHNRNRGRTSQEKRGKWNVRKTFSAFCHSRHSNHYPCDNRSFLIYKNNLKWGKKNMGEKTLDGNLALLTNGSRIRSSEPTKKFFGEHQKYLPFCSFIRTYISSFGQQLFIQPREGLIYGRH